MDRKDFLTAMEDLGRSLEGQVIYSVGVWRDR